MVLSELRRYVALGDSYSAGLPGDAHLSWPAMLADELRRTAPDLAYWNLAVVGATTREVLSSQLPAALERRPELVTVVCGLNDVLYSVRPDVVLFEASFAAIVRALQSTRDAPVVLTATVPDLSRFVPFRPRSRARVARGIDGVNRVVRAISARYGCRVVDIERSPHGSDPASFASDGIHASALGHARMAEGALDEIRRWARSAATPGSLPTGLQPRREKTRVSDRFRIG